MSESDDFDWSPLGEKFWRSAAEACQRKPSEQQLRFAVCKWNGLNASDSAAKAGYEGDDAAIRVGGHRASKSTAVAVPTPKPARAMTALFLLPRLVGFFHGSAARATTTNA